MKTYPDLSALAIKEKLDLSLRLWYILRESFPCGWARLEDVHDVSGCNRRRTRILLGRGDGVFWTRSNGRVWLKSLGKVCQTLGVRVRKNPVHIDDSVNLAQFRAMLFKSWFADAGGAGRTISQKALSEIFGRTSRTLRTWAKIANITVVHNLATKTAPKPGDDLTGYPSGTLEAMNWGRSWLDDPNDKPNMVWNEWHDGIHYLCWRIPSTYVSADLVVGRKTNLQRMAIRNALDYCDEGKFPKRYYGKDSDGRSIVKAIQQKRVVYLQSDKRHCKSGETLWTRL